MKRLIDIVTQKYEVKMVYLSFVEENHPARQLYENLGFEFTGEIDPEGELIYKYEVWEGFK